MTSGKPQKRQKLSDGGDQSEGLTEVETAKLLESIDSCQTEIDNLSEKASEEILLVEQKYLFISFVISGYYQGSLVIGTIIDNYDL